MKDSDRERMMRYAKLPDSEQETISNLGYLGVKLTKKVIRDKQKQKKKKSKGSEDVPDMMYELSRFVPRIKGILQQLVNGEISDADYPIIAEKTTTTTTTTTTSAGDGKKKKKALKAAPKWADKSKSSPTAAASGSASGQDEDFVGAADSDPRFIVFIAGGMTYSETRSVYEVAKKVSKNCYIGSTQFLTPPVFVHELSLLSKTPDQAKQLEDTFLQKLAELAKPLPAAKKKSEPAATASATE